MLEAYSVDDLFNGVVITLLGCVLILFRERIAQTVIRNQNKTWGFSFGDVEADLSEAVAVFAGVTAIGLGMLMLFG